MKCACIRKGENNAKKFDIPSCDCDDKILRYVTNPWADVLIVFCVSMAIIRLKRKI